MAGRVVYSLTGQEINLSEATTESLAEVVDGYNEEVSRLKEARQIVMRELAKRMGPMTRTKAGEFDLTHSPWVNVSRRLDP